MAASRATDGITWFVATFGLRRRPEAVTYQGELYDLAFAAAEQTGYDLDFVLKWINAQAVGYDSGTEVTTTDFEDFLASRSTQNEPTKSRSAES